MGERLCTALLNVPNSIESVFCRSQVDSAPEGADGRVTGGGGALYSGGGGTLTLSGGASIIDVCGPNCGRKEPERGALTGGGGGIECTGGGTGCGELALPPEVPACCWAAKSIESAAWALAANWADVCELLPD